MATRAVARADVTRAERLSLPRPNAMVLLALVPAAIIVGLLLLVVWISFRESVTSDALTLRHYASLYTDPFAYSALLNTIGFTAVTLFVALVLGVPIAWLVERTDIRGKSGIITVMTMSVLIPGFFTAMGWLFLAHPRIGMLNQIAMNVFGLQSGPFSVVNIPGMGFIQGLNLASLIFIMTVASLRAMDASLEESSQMSGATFLQTMRRVTLPLASPGLLAAALYTLTTAISAFDIPLIIGLSNRIFLFSTFMYVKTNPQEGLPEYGLPAAFATFMLVLAVGLSWWYSRMLVQARRYQVVTGKNYKPKLVQLGPWAIAAWAFLGAYILIAKVLPLLLLVWASLLPYLQPPSLAALGTVSLKNFNNLPWPLIQRGLTNTVVCVIVAPAIALLVSLVFSWVVLRTRSRLRLGFDFIAFLPHAVPHTVFGFAALLAALFVIRGPVDLYGSLALLVIMYSIVHISFGTRITNSALIQISNELEEAASVSGASLLQTLRRIVVPLLTPAFLYGGLSLGLLTFRELTLATMLFSPDNITLSVVVWSLFHSGNLAQAAAVTLIMMLLLLPLVLIYLKFGGTVGGGVRTH
ncbi:MAG TPA: iron ABC transporter permease [Chloroflexota bacterium]|nr:iron ABC transporter permease [Chloroflexota bacterium]